MLTVAAAQDAPVFLDRAATTARVLEWMEKAAGEGVKLLAFGETQSTDRFGSPAPPPPRRAICGPGCLERTTALPSRIRDHI